MKLWFSSSKDAFYHNIAYLKEDGYSEDKILPVARDIQERARKMEDSRAKYEAKYKK